MKLKTINFVCLVTVLVVGLGACSVAEGESEPEAPRPVSHGVWATYDSLEALAENAELVVIGEVGDFVERHEMLLVDELAGTTSVVKADDLYEFFVEEPIIGSQTRTIRVGAADFGDEPNASGFKTAERLVLFLASAPFRSEDGSEVFLPLSANTGVFRVEGDRVVSTGVVGATADIDMRLDDLVTQTRAAAGAEG